jgi:hypothetical protein
LLEKLAADLRRMNAEGAWFASADDLIGRLRDLFESTIAEDSDGPSEPAADESS